MKNYHIVLNKYRKVIKFGGGPVNTADLPVWYLIEWFDTEQEMLDDPRVKGKCDREDAFNALHKINKRDRKQALIAKAMQAEAYLVEFPINPFTAESDLTDPNIIDAVKYDLIADEYWLTFDLVDWDPHELCTRIVDRARVEQSEGQLRRDKLIAEKTIEENS